MGIDLTVGTVIGARYRLERLLGEGGMGVVWAAEDLATRQRCALKLMKDAAGDPAARQRFLREGRAASAVRHPNVVGILDVIEPEGEPPAIVMELLEGESLRARLGNAQKLAPGELAEIMVPVVSAVGAAHALGIVHRDLKPENIFLARGPAGERIVKVLDFGIAKLTALDGEAMRSTGITTGTVLGTPAYMAPEQVFAERDLDHRADVWALGIILYECLSGVCPTRGDNVGQVCVNSGKVEFRAWVDGDKHMDVQLYGGDCWTYHWWSGLFNADSIRVATTILSGSANYFLAVLWNH